MRENLVNIKANPLKKILLITITGLLMKLITYIVFVRNGKHGD